MTTDYRSLCAELLQAWDDLPWEYDISPLAEIDDTPFDRARAALAQSEPEGRPWPVPGDAEGLAEVFWGNYDQFEPEGTTRNRAEQRTAQPEPEGPTDEELRQVLLDCGYHPENRHLTALARAVLARWGRPAITPIPISERPPGPEDCDAEGRCWFGGKYRTWKLIRSDCVSPDSCWLPAHALPLPSGDHHLNAD